MGKKRILGLLVIVAALGGLIWQIWRNREPTYDGKPLSFWLENYDTVNLTETSRQAADHALQSMGTNALAVLINRIQAQDSSWKLFLYDLLAKRHIIKRDWKWAAEQRFEAQFGFMALKSEAKPAVPALIKAYKDNGPSRQIQDTVIGAIGAIGPAAKEAVPMLVSALTNSNIDVRICAAQALGNIHSEPAIAVPALTDCLSDTYGGLGDCATTALLKYGTNAGVAVPTLMKLLAHESATVRYRSIAALRAINPAAAAKAQTPAQ